MRLGCFARLSAITGVLLLALLTVGLLPAWADCPGTPLRNAGFEDGFSTRGAGEVEVANGWTPFWQDGPFAAEGLNRRPEYKAEDAARFGRRRVRQGNWAQKWGNTYATHHAGIYQQVNVPAGSTVTLRAWAQAWSSAEDDISVSTGGKYALSVGIDPTGGTDWTSPNIVWSAPNYTLDQWVELTVQATAKGGTVTIYLRGDAEWRMKHNDAYFDDICVTYVAPPPPPTNTPRPTSPPTATPLPSSTPTATASPTPEATATPKPAAIKVLAFEDRNGNGLRDAGEPLLAGAHITVLNMQRTPLATHKTDGASEPYTFGGLAPGQYLVTEEDPPGYTSTAPKVWGVALAEGTEMTIAFCLRFAPTATPTWTPSPAPSPTAPATVVPATAAPTAAPTPAATAAPTFGQRLYQVSGILVALMALVILVGYTWLKNRVS